MNQISKRVCIYPKDIQRITGKSYRQSTRILNEIRKSLRKPKNSLVSIEEFCKKMHKKCYFLFLKRLQK